MTRLRTSLQEQSAASSTFCRGPPGPPLVVSTRLQELLHKAPPPLLDGTEEQRRDLQLFVHNLSPVRLWLDEGVERV